MRTFCFVLLLLLLTACSAPSSGVVPEPPTSVPATSVPATSVPATSVPATSVPPTSVPPTSVPAPTTQPITPPIAQVPSGLPAEILFLRNRNLVALDPTTGSVRTLAPEVNAFAATPDGQQIAVVRAGSLWLIKRDGTGLRQLTTVTNASGAPAWAPDGLSLVYTSSPVAAPVAPDWFSWSGWCAQAEVRLLDLVGPTPNERRLGAGCEPRFSPDGQRIAFTAPPSSAAPGTDQQNANNSIQLVNRQGANGWEVAQSAGGPFETSMLVYSPAWSPDGQQLAYQRFVGYQVLVDINLTEASSTFTRRPTPLDSGAGWLLPPHYAPNGQRLAVTEHNYSDARGFGGYDAWRTTVLQLGTRSEQVLPSATLMMQAERFDQLNGATAATWSPDGSTLAVALPQGWQPTTNLFEPAYPETGPGELWLWQPGSVPTTRLFEGLDFATPLQWLPAEPGRVAGARELVAPAGWEVSERPGYLAVATPLEKDGRLLAIKPTTGNESVADLLPAAQLGDPIPLPDGSVLRRMEGTNQQGISVTGMLRLTRSGTLVIYLAPAEQWPQQQALALGLLVASGR